MLLLWKIFYIIHKLYQPISFLSSIAILLIRFITLYMNYDLLISEINKKKKGEKKKKKTFDIFHL